ncbi:hypothetical protein O3P69_005377 [Scylla paramamosain]|uniref:Uncharacterized protein n=1 Tax=Scylla paramamosain TaxID=85552 RepID=A0AAW0U888_SCYPA
MTVTACLFLIEPSVPFTPRHPSVTRLPTPVTRQSPVTYPSTNTHHPTPVTRQSPVTRHSSCITHHPSPVTHHMVTEGKSGSSSSSINISMVEQRPRGQAVEAEGSVLVMFVIKEDQAKQDHALFKCKAVAPLRGRAAAAAAAVAAWWSRGPWVQAVEGEGSVLVKFVTKQDQGKQDHALFKCKVKNWKWCSTNHPGGHNRDSGPVATAVTASEDAVVTIC